MTKLEEALNKCTFARECPKYDTNGGGYYIFCLKRTKVSNSYFCDRCPYRNSHQTT